MDLAILLIIVLNAVYALGCWRGYVYGKDVGRHEHLTHGITRGQA